MKILVFTNRKRTEEVFSALISGRSHDVEIHPRAEYRDRLKLETNPCMVYFDISGMSRTDQKKELRYLLKQENSLTAVIDDKGELEDPAAFFHEGGVDYLGKKQMREGVSLGRLKAVFSFIGQDHPLLSAPSASAADTSFTAPLVPDGKWKHVKPGHEYMFHFLFAELDLTDEWKKKSGREHLKLIEERFHEYIRKAFEPINGRVWMWNEFGGLVLFPCGEPPFPVVLAACKLMVNRNIASCEEFPFKTPISFRLGLHLGETVYMERGNTGTIVSDTINFTFHLGTRYARPGSLYITKPVYDHTHPGLKDLFVKDAPFEGREVYRMRRIL